MIRTFIYFFCGTIRGIVFREQPNLRYVSKSVSPFSPRTNGLAI